MMLGSVAPHGIAVVIMAVTVFLLIGRRVISVETGSLIIIGSLAVLFYSFPLASVGAGSIAPTSFYYGFGHEALIAICCLMIHGHALVSTGALEPLARLLGRLWSWNSTLALLGVLLVSMGLSSVLNDTPVVILMLPVLVSVALRTGSTPAKTLMPMNFAVLAGGMTTTIGTSTNLLVVSIASDLGVRPFGMFDFTPIALAAVVPAILYLWLIAPRLLVDRRPPLDSTRQRVFQAVLHVGTGSYPDGHTLAETIERAGGRLQVDRIQRGSGDYIMRFPTLKLRAGDKIFVRATPEKIKELEQVLSVKLHASSDSPNSTGDTLDVLPKARAEQLAEVVITNHSPLVERSLRDSRFVDRHGVAVVALHRPPSGEVLERELYDLALKPGDVLLVQGPQPQIAVLKSDPALLVLDGSAELPHTRKAPHALGIMAIVVGAAGFGVVPIYIGAIAGVIALLLTRTLPVENLGRALKADVILMIAASLALGRAINETGVAQAIGGGFGGVATYLPPGLVLGLLMAVMAVFTNFVSNTAAAAVGTPLAVSLANELGLAPEPFVLAVLFGCNLSFVTPMGYQTNILIMATGDYRFSDYVRVGLPLAIMLAAVLSYALVLKYFS